MAKGTDNKLQYLVEKIKSLNEEIEEIKPLAEIKEVKKFNKSGHIIFEGKFVGEKVLIIKIPKLN